MIEQMGTGRSTIKKEQYILVTGKMISNMVTERKREKASLFMRDNFITVARQVLANIYSRMAPRTQVMSRIAFSMGKGSSNGPMAKFIMELGKTIK